MMISITATDAKRNLHELIKQSHQQHNVFEIKHKSGNAIMMSAEKYEGLQETLTLLSQVGFKEAFDESVKQLESGETVSFDEVFSQKK